MRSPCCARSLRLEEWIRLEMDLHAKHAAIRSGSNEWLDHPLARSPAVAVDPVGYTIRVQHEDRDPACDVDRSNPRSRMVVIAAVIAIQTTALRALGYLAPLVQEVVAREIGGEKH